MSKRDLLSVALKVAGVVTFASSLSAIPWTVEEINMTLTGRFVGVSNKPLFVTMSVGGVLAGLLIGAYLATKSDNLANWLERDHSRLDANPSEWVRPAFGVAVRVVGIVLIARSLPDLVETFAERYLVFHNAGMGLRDAFSSSGNFWADQWSAIIRNCASILIGAYLLLGAASLARLVMPEQRDEVDATAE